MFFKCVSKHFRVDYDPLYCFPPMLLPCGKWKCQRNIVFWARAMAIIHTAAKDHNFFRGKIKSNKRPLFFFSLSNKYSNVPMVQCNCKKRFEIFNRMFLIKNLIHKKIIIRSRVWESLITAGQRIEKLTKIDLRWK